MMDATESSLLTNDIIIQLIIFRVGEEEFGVPIDTVREIIKTGIITPIPKSEQYIKGIINVRGEIVTTIDLKSRFALKHPDDGESKHIIVTRQDGSLFGLMVDEVIEVLRVMKKDIKPPPELLTKIDQQYIHGVISHENRLIILIDLSLIFSENQSSPRQRSQNPVFDKKSETHSKRHKKNSKYIER